jgi:hypothetical protein
MASFGQINACGEKKEKPPAARGNAHGAWRFAHSVKRNIRFAPCALRFA